MRAFELQAAHEVTFVEVDFEEKNPNFKQAELQAD